MIYNKFDIVKLPFPFTDKNTAKRRPSLVISSKDYQTNHNHCVLVMITSAKQSSWVDDIDITNIVMSGISSPSKIRFKIFTLDVSLILEKIGCLIGEDQLKVQQKLEYYLL
jgi:mRNA interferase MazF